MTQPEQQQFKSLRSGRIVIPGWVQLVPGQDDIIEFELDLDEKDRSKSQVVVLIEYWATPEALTVQSVLPGHAFNVNSDGWCAFLPAQGKVLVRAIDAEPLPPILASHQVNLDPQTILGTIVKIKISFP